MLPVGAQAPDFTLTDHLGGQVTLSELRGRNSVVLVFYPADFSNGCTGQLCALRDDYRRFQEAGAVVLAISAAPRFLNRAFAVRHGFQFQLLVDLFQRVARLYEAAKPGVPLLNKRVVYVIGRDGRILFAEEGMPSDARLLEALDAEPAGTIDDRR
jgi:peroxiredoxin